MSAKCLDKQGRWRNKTVAFRVSPEEDELLETAVRLSGLTKQDYIIRRLQEKEVVVTGNPRVYKALKNELTKVLNELKRLKKGDNVPEDLLEVIRLITITKTTRFLCQKYLLSLPSTRLSLFFQPAKYRHDVRHIRFLPDHLQHLPPLA